jgi:hypothetical protein
MTSGFFSFRLSYIELKDHLSKYGFVETPCSIPKNRFQFFKRFIYLKIYDKSPKLFYFLRDRVSPIKFLSERPDGSLWFSIKDSDGSELYSLFIDRWGKLNQLDQFIQTDIRVGVNNHEVIIPLGEKMIESLDKFLQTFPELKSKYRNYRLNQIC